MFGEGMSRLRGGLQGKIQAEVGHESWDLGRREVQVGKTRLFMLGAVSWTTPGAVDMQGGFRVQGLTQRAPVDGDLNVPPTCERNSVIMA